VAIQGSALYDAAQQVHANGKKALAIGLKYLDSRKGHPSGTNDDDFYAHVLSEMYKQSNGAAVSLADDGEPKEAVIEESDVDSQITASDMAAEDTADGAITSGVKGSAEASLETYGNGKFFKGFAAFVLFGPLAPESEQSDLFKFQDFLKPSEDKKVAGRDAAWKEELQDKKREREASTSGVRGSTVASRTELVQAVQQDAAEQQRDHENQLMVLNQMLKTLGEEINSAERQATRSCPDYDPDHEDWAEYRELLKNRKRKQEELETLSKEMLKPRQVKNKALQGLVKTVAPDSYVDLCGDDDGNKKPKAKMNPQSRPSSHMSSCPSSPTASETE
jgi:hypothetical protein